LTELIRISKRISNSGFCSRRDAEKIIMSGRVKVNNEVITSLSLKISLKDIVKVDNKIINLSDIIRIWLYHKKKGYLVTNKDPFKRPTIFEDLKNKINIKFISVGRLDFNSEGLLILTNNGDLARKLELPSSGYLRKYKVKVRGVVDKLKLESLKNGIKINKINYGSIISRIINQNENYTWLDVSLKEGKNREIRKVFLHLGYKVNRLIRISFGPFNLKNIKPGEVAEVKQNKVKNLI